MQKGVSSTQVNKKDIMRGINIAIQGYSGIINTQPPDLIPDNAVTSIANFLPIGNGTVRKIQAPALYASLSVQPIKLINDVINGSLVMFIINSDGSAGTVSSAGVYAQVASAGTFSGISSNIQIANWQNKYFLIIDSVKGYFAYSPVDPTTVSWSANTAYAVGQITVQGNYYYYCITAGTSGSSAPAWNTTVGGTTKDNTVVWVTFIYSNGFWILQPGITGNTIVVFQGRVMIAGNRNIQYSAPLSFIDFTIANGAGTFSISTPDLKQNIQQLIAYMNNLYVVGDHSVTAITGAVISNDPSTWYIQEIFNNTGTIYDNSIINFNNVIYLVNEYGIWQISSSQSQKIDYSIDTTKFSFFNGTSAIAMINNLNFYLTPIQFPVTPAYQNINGKGLLAYCIDLQQYFYIDLNINIYGVYSTISISDHSVYLISDNSIYKLGAGNSNLTATITTKVFDFGNNFFFKIFRRVGFNINVISGVPNFSLATTITNSSGTIGTQPALPISTITVVTGTYPLSIPNISSPVYFYIPNIPNVPLGLSFVRAQVYMPLFYVNQGGVSISLNVSETSNSIFDIVQTYIVGNLGRSLI